ncbi:hypothetical protein [Methanomethylophilus alvi]|uniref:hypothetical protein n=1 Tax=Methanomethylophilus alvi TaxID=1291540 RepID=UPI0037DC14D0
MMDSKDVVDGIWEYFGFPQGNLKNKALKHAEKLRRYYVETLKEFEALGHEDLEASYGLFLSSYFLDDAFDSTDSPYALAIGLHLYTGFVCYIQKEHPEKMEVLKEYFRIQMIYQSAEKDRDNEKGYDLSYINELDNYHLKQIILLFPLELSEPSIRDDLYELYIHYFDCILLTDDMIDAEEDMATGTMTAITSGCRTEEDISESRKKCRKKFIEHKDLTMSLMSTIGIHSKTLISVLDDMDRCTSGICKRV